MKLTDEQFAVLQRNEIHLDSSYYGYWVRNIMPEEGKALREIDIAFGGANDAFSYSCGECVLRMCRRLAPIYYADRDERASAKKVAKTATKATAKKAVKMEA